MAITVTYGGNSESLDGLEGKTVCEVRSAFKALWRIDDGAEATVNNRSANDTDTLRDGDTLVFAASTASKGS